MNKTGFLLIISLLFVFSSCNKNLISTRFTGSNFSVDEIQFDQIKAKTKIRYNEGKKTIKGNANIRIQKDSVIWVSLSPSVGIEVTRALITRDTIKVINRLEKTCYIFNFKEFSDRMNFEITFDLIQNILLGNVPVIAEMPKKVSKKEDYIHLVEDNGPINIDSYINVKYRKLESVVMRQQGTGNSLSLKYSEFKDLNKSLFPYVCLVNLTYDSKEGPLITSINIEHDKVEVSDKPLKFPFNIPGKYEFK